MTREEAERLFPGRRVLAVSPLAGGRRNSHHRVDLADGSSAVLRLYADPASLPVELAVHRRLAGSVPLPEILDAGEDFLVLAFVAGEPLAGGPPELFAAIGGALAAIHAHALPRIGFLAADLEVVTTLPALPELLEHMLAPVAEQLGLDRFAALRARIARHATRLAELDAQAVLVHGDFRPPNLLVHQGRLAAILDWEFAMAGHALADLGQWIRHEDELPPGSVDRLVAAYGSLPADWRELARLCDLANLLQMLAAPDRPRQQAGALALVDRTLARPG